MGFTVKELTLILETDYNCFVTESSILDKELYNSLIDYGIAWIESKKFYPMASDRIAGLLVPRAGLWF